MEELVNYIYIERKKVESISEANPHLREDMASWYRGYNQALMDVEEKIKSIENVRRD